MRIIAGAAKGRRLLSPKGQDTRPLTDFMRESLFSSLGALVVDARVLDLYAGTGSIGLEALSRGAAGAVFVERSRPALNTLERNVAAVGLGGEVVASDVLRYLERCQDSFDLAFVDPPYALSLASLSDVLHGLDGVLDAGAVVVVHRRGEEPAPVVPPGWRQTDRRRHGGSEVWRYAKEAA